MAMAYVYIKPDWMYRTRIAESHTDRAGPSTPVSLTITRSNTATSLPSPRKTRSIAHWYASST